MDINTRVRRLRELMDEKGIDAYIIPSEDPHQSEYVADHYKGRTWISGFTGSAGTVVITKDRALLWTDGRYFIQAEKELEGSDYHLMKMGMAEVPNYSQWLKDNLRSGQSLGFDGRVFAESLAREFEAICEEKRIKLKDEFDLVGHIWKNRPGLPKGDSFVHDIKYTGLSTKEKIEEVRRAMEVKNADYFLISSLDDIAWLYNVRGRDIKNSPVIISYGLISKERAYLFVDKAKINTGVGEFLKASGVELREYEEVKDFVENIEKDSTILLDENKVNRWLYKGIPEECKIINQVDITTRLKAIKNKTEIDSQRKAYLKDGVALVKFLSWIDKNIGKTDINEITAGEKLLGFREEGDLFIEPSFETISAYGPNAAMAHYRASEEDFSILEPKGLYLVDSGGQYMDGTTDITRTVALGKLTEEEKRDFTLTLKGHINLIDSRFLDGTTGYQLDILCRQPLWQEGLDYKHGTGHGIGFLLNVHEGPHRIASVFNDVVLEKGMVVSIEPGVYKNGKHGIRIENIVVVDEDIETESGNFLSFEVLSYVPIDLNCIDESLLNNREKAWLNNYHREVFEKLSPYLEPDENKWLKEKTKAILN